MNLENIIKESLIKASRVLPWEIENKIALAYEKESGKYSKRVLGAIGENISIARAEDIPLCQDTGLLWTAVELGSRSGIDIYKLDKSIKRAAESAFLEGSFRKSIVSDPIYERVNTKTNMPIDILYEVVDSDTAKIMFLLKGFGSENVSRVKMLSPTSSEDGLIEFVLESVKLAGGKPCPPIFLGIGVGGTMDRAAYLSKKAFFKEGDKNDLEKKILKSVNSLGIGAGGLGGEYTALGVSLLDEPTHIAGLPVAITVSCWAERKAEITIKGGQSGEIVSSIL